MNDKPEIIFAVPLTKQQRDAVCDFYYHKRDLLLSEGIDSPERFSALVLMLGLDIFRQCFSVAQDKHIPDSYRDELLGIAIEQSVKKLSATINSQYLL